MNVNKQTTVKIICEVCGISHNNKGEGLCDRHMLEQDQNERETYKDRIAAKERFMEFSNEDKWDKVFDLLYAQDLL